jgi:hypothetical protein
VATRLANTAGECNGATTTAVPNRSEEDVAAKKARSSSGSGMGTAPGAPAIRPLAE